MTHKLGLNFTPHRAFLSLPATTSVNKGLIAAEQKYHIEPRELDTYRTSHATLYIDQMKECHVAPRREITLAMGSCSSPNDVGSHHKETHHTRRTLSLYHQDQSTLPNRLTSSSFRGTSSLGCQTPKRQQRLGRFVIVIHPIA